MKEENFEEFEEEEDFDDNIEDLSDEEENETMGGKTTTTVTKVYHMSITETNNVCYVGKQLRTQISPAINQYESCTLTGGSGTTVKSTLPGTTLKIKRDQTAAAFAGQSYTIEGKNKNGKACKVYLTLKFK